MGANESVLGGVVEEDPCEELLVKYVKCAEKHHNVAPEPYETDYCEEEKGLYIECRTAWIAANKRKGGEKEG